MYEFRNKYLYRKLKWQKPKQKKPLSNIKPLDSYTVGSPWSQSIGWQEGFMTVQQAKYVCHGQLLEVVAVELVGGVCEWIVCAKFGHQAFSVVVPTAWNSLPAYVCESSLSKDTFKQLLKTYLFALY